MSFLRRYWYLATFEGASLISYVSVLISPTIFWPCVLLSYAIPVFLFLNGLLAIVLAIRWWRLCIFPLIGLALGFPFLLSSVAFSSNPTAPGKSISVLSLNAKLFRKSNTYAEFSPEMIKWVVEDSSDIKCIQEYSTDNRWEPLNVTGMIKARGYQAFTMQSRVEDRDHNPGLGIFTKFDIVHSGVIWGDTTNSNGVMFADIRMNDDTLRVYNVHLGSMALQIHQYKEPDNYLDKMKDLARKLKAGAVSRSFQIDLLMEHAGTSPYPFLICGDFNETPYSYNYFRLRSHFSNAFEEAGHGFGFTINSALFFLRIDHQFHSSGLKALNFGVDRTMRISDHFATRGSYVIGQPGVKFASR